MQRFFAGRYSRCVAMLGASTVAAPSIASRTNVVFSEAEAKLAQLQKLKQFQSNVWVDAKDKDYLKFEVKPGETPVEAYVPKKLELYNADQLDPRVEGTETEPSAAGEHSFSSKKPYSGRIAQTLEERKAVKQWQSRWWVSKSALRKYKSKAKSNEYTTDILMSSKAVLYNADQLTDPSVVTQVPVSAGSAKLYHPDSRKSLLEHCKQIGAPFPLYLTEKQANRIGVTIVPNSTPALLLIESQTFLLYNASQTSNPKLVFEKAGQF